VRVLIIRVFIRKKADTDLPIILKKEKPVSVLHYYAMLKNEE